MALHTAGAQRWIEVEEREKEREKKEQKAHAEVDIAQLHWEVVVCEKALPGLPQGNEEADIYARLGKRVIEYLKKVQIGLD